MMRADDRLEGGRSRGRRRAVKQESLGRPDTPTLGLCLLLLFALMFGGGGSPAEMAELAVQLAALVIVGWIALATGRVDHLSISVLRRDWLLGGLAVALVALYILQLIPLPPSLWSALPGRAAIALNLKPFDEAPWLPLTVAPHFTIAALLSLIPPFAAYALASRSDRDAGPWVMRTLAVFAVLTVSLQMLQITGGFFLYDPKGNFAFTNGFQANRNSQGDILAILVAALAMRQLGGWGKGAFAAQQLALGFGLMLAAVLTGSRAGMLMTAAMLFVLVYRLLAENGVAIARRPGLALGGAMLAAGGAALAATLNPVIMRTVSRFSTGIEGRLERIWPDAIYAMEQFLPWGAGFGSFVPAFQIYESQETFSELIANRAHSEPLEVLIEGGIPGAVVVGGLVLAVLWRAFGELRLGLGKDERLRAFLLLIASLLMLAHSMVDYPLRSMSIAVLLSVLLGLVVADRRRRLETNAETPSTLEGEET